MDDLLERIFPFGYSITRVHGGDINQTFLVTYDGQDFFIKYNSSDHAAAMLEAEVKGLQLLAETLPDNIPKVLETISGNSGSILTLEYLDVASDKRSDQHDLGYILATLHKASSAHFGLDHDNFIGSLYQKNEHYKDFTTFYLDSRLEPQLRLAVDNQLLESRYVHNINKLGSTIRNEVPEEVPSLIHGDLWGGNYLKVKNGNFYLIDPSVSFAHREMDIAMTMLFGGFSDEFYSSYVECFPLESGWKKRVSLFQLYYLLVHLNIFGKSYKPSVVNILNQWN